MRKNWVSAVCGFAMSASSVAAQTQSVGGPPQIVTTGAGEASAIPDRATVNVAVQTRATTVSAASGDNARRVTAIMDTLRALGIAGDQVTTANYSVNPEMSYPTTSSQVPRVVAYVVNNSLLIKLRRIEDAGRVIDASLSKGANEISSLGFSSSKADSVRSVALAAAVADARAQADVMARAAGGSLGPLLELSTSAPIRPMPLMQPMAMRAAVQTPITPGEQTVNAVVTARWTFIPGR